MTLLSVIVSYNRLDLLQRTLASYRETVSVPHELVVVDNDSDEETYEWLYGCGETVLWLPENRYPGFATNHGWEWLTDRHNGELLHRSDNDVEYQLGWCDEVLERFADPKLGQLGLRTVEEEGPQGAVGGNCVIRRELWEQGIRYGGSPWSEVAFEDAALSWNVQNAGYTWGRAQVPCIEHIGICDRSPYYQETFGVRGITFAEYGV